MSISREGLIRRDHGMQNIMKKILLMPTQQVMVGWPGNGPVHNDVEHVTSKTGKKRAKKTARMHGMSVASIAVVHEFGAPIANIPSRPVMTQTTKKYSGVMGPLKARLLREVYAGRLTTTQALAQMGLYWEGKVKGMFREGDFQELSPATIAAKGSSRPLIDTAQLRNSCTSRVVNA